MTEIPTLDLAPLFGGPGAARDAADAALIAAATGPGFMLATGVPGDALAPETRRRLLALFDLPETELRKLWRRKFDPSRPNVYRGYYPAQPGMPSYKDGVDLGPDVARPEAADPSDPLTEPTPTPPEDALPGWRAAVAAYYEAMEAVGDALLRGFARGFGLPERRFAEKFTNGISTFRLIRYPVRDAASFGGEAPPPGPDGRYQLGGEHVDSGFITLLAQDGVPGLESQTRDGAWILVPPIEGALTVNFGKLLALWTGGRVRATVHRVMGHGVERFSIPFFLEPAVDAEIAPIPELGGDPFEPFLFGDYVWATTTQFTEFRGMEDLRPPRAPSR